MDDGATELDMVINIGQAIGGNWDAVAGDIAAVTRAAHERGALVKVILENCYLNDEQKAKLCQICGELKADYVKTSTGYGTGGATHEDLILMRKSAPTHIKLKAAGGVRTLENAIAVLEAPNRSQPSSTTAIAFSSVRTPPAALSLMCVGADLRIRMRSSCVAPPVP